MPTATGEWKDWLSRHGAALVLFARQWTATHADAQDVVQEAFLRFLRSRSRAADPKAYLYQCIKRTALDWLRGQRRRTRRELVAARPEATPREPLFVAELEAEERRKAVEKVVSELPEAQREVLVLKVWGELTFPQIAETLRISANTAASRYRYALEKLRVSLADEKPDA